MDDLTPRQIVAELDRYIVGQAKAKRAVAIALRNRYRRRLLSDDLREEVIPKNILMIGPTGVGKTEIARRLARLANAPFVKIEATKFTEVGYVGRDVDSMIRDIAQVAYGLVEEEHMVRVQDRARERAVDRIVDSMHPMPSSAPEPNKDFANMASAFRMYFPGMAPGAPPAETVDEDDRRRTEQAERIRARLREQVEMGVLDEKQIEIDLEESAPVTFMPAFGQGGMEEIGVNLGDVLGGMFNKRKRARKVTVREAKDLLTQEEARTLIDMDQVKREAVERAEQSGIVFIDEIDKVAGKDGGIGPDVSRGGVQRDLLPIIEGSTVTTKYGPVRTDHMLFIAAGAFHMSKPSDLIPELQGRMPIRVELEDLTEEDFRRILTEPRNALTKQYAALLATEGVTIQFTDDGIAELARTAVDVNRRTENIGARRLHTMMEKLLEDVAFEAPETVTGTVTVDAEYVRGKLEKIASDQDLSRYIL